MITIGALAALRQRILHNHGATLDYIIRFPQAGDPRHDILGDADIHQEYVILVVVDDPVQQLHQFGMAHRRQAALKDGQLQPLPKPLHEPEDAPPALWIRNVISNYVQMIVPHGTTAS
jgi:hypothetical protein